MILGIYNIQESQKVGTGRDFKIIRSKPLTLQMRKATQSEEAEVEFQSWGGGGGGMDREWQEGQTSQEWSVQ